MVGGERDGKIAKFSAFSESLPQSPFTEGVELGKIVAFKNNFLELISAMLLTGNGHLQKSTNIDSIGGNDAENLVNIASDLALSQSVCPKIAIRVAYGGTIEMPFRALGYIFPALIYAEILKNQNVQVQIIFPNNITTSLNALPKDVVRDQSRKFSEVARRCIQAFFPKAEESVVFLEDTPLEKKSLLRNELLNVASVLRDKLPESLREELGEKGSEARSRINFFYGAAHLLIHDIDMPGVLVPILPSQPPIIRPNTIINIGGNKEQLFYKLRQAVKANLGAEYSKIRTLQFFTKHMVPPYIMTRFGKDISLGSILEGEKLDYASLAKPVQQDLDYISYVIGSEDGLVNFIKKERELYGK